MEEIKQSSVVVLCPLCGVSYFWHLQSVECPHWTIMASDTVRIGQKENDGRTSEQRQP
uniref:Uncharacterized protein n=1 Tax=viral metagenome TaxID=1070528 RepID=A0A6H1ZG08_9ZZZZ